MKLVDRAIDICIKPRATFLEIEREKAGFTALYRDYLLWLAGLPALVKLVAGLAGRGGSAALARPPLAATLSVALLDYICVLAGVYALALAVNALAPLFGGERDEDRALRLCAYALTPTFLAGATGALPGLAWTSVLSLYSIALVIVGLPRLMRCEEDRALGYGASAAIAMAAIALATSLLTSRVLPHS
ncbi:Yip1 domain-containing protein [Rhizobiales bacterium GAS188]|nr:Yip1 domain-containing protein [Rhizobiales bacterium GAS188]